MTVGERIKQRRIELNLSQDELAKRVGYKSRSSINKIELARELPLRKVEKMAVALDVTPGYLMGWEEDINTETKLLEAYKQKAHIRRYYELLANHFNQKLLDAAEGCTDQQKQIAIDMLNTFKKGD